MAKIGRNDLCPCGSRIKYQKCCLYRDIISSNELNLLRIDNINLVLSTVRAAKRKEKVTAELQLHNDQGFQYTSQAYFNLMQSYHITPSMSRCGNPYDNALAENFFSILKTECLYRVKLRSYEEACLLIAAYIDFYNNERIQLKTKLTPREMRCQFAA